MMDFVVLCGSIIIGGLFGVLVSLIPGYRPLSILWVLGALSIVGSTVYLVGCISGYFSSLLVCSVREALLPEMSGSVFTLRHFRRDHDNERFRAWALVEEYKKFKIGGILSGLLMAPLLSWVSGSIWITVIVGGLVVYSCWSGPRRLEILGTLILSSIFFLFCNSLHITQPILLLGNLLFLIPASISSLKRKSNRENLSTSAKPTSLDSELVKGINSSSVWFRAPWNWILSIIGILGPGVSVDALVQIANNEGDFRYNRERDNFFCNGFIETLGVASIFSPIAGCFGKSVLGAELCGSVIASTMTIWFIPIAIFIGIIIGLAFIKPVFKFLSAAALTKSSKTLHQINLGYLILTSILISLSGVTGFLSMIINMVFLGCLSIGGLIIYREVLDEETGAGETPIGAYLFLGPIATSLIK